MCGIFGVFNLKGKQAISAGRISSSLQQMKHRGPDASGCEVFGEQAALAHLRLSIIDLDACSNQPFRWNDRYWIAFNGEIYNYLELRAELAQRGYQFRTHSDTEVLLAAYVAWGPDCVQRFNGMWAFAIYDTEQEELFCSRDRFGVKPFNYAVVEGQFLFSSEIKSMLAYAPQLRVPNYKIIANYVRTSLGAQTEETWFKDILRLPPAYNLVVNASGIKKMRYWDYPRKVNKGISYEQAVDTYRQIMADALQLRMRSDVPVGLTLSSGLDSTSIVCMLDQQAASNRKTYTASFDHLSFHKSEKANFKKDIEINEPSLVRRLAADTGFDPSFIAVDYNQYIADLKRIIWHMESGHGSPAVFPLDQVLRRAAQDVTVVLEGQGADELLGGYISNLMPVYLLQLVRKGQWKKAKEEFKKFTGTYSFKTALMLFVRQSKLSFIKNLYYKSSGIDSLLVGALKGQPALEDYPIEPKGFDDDINTHLFKAHTGGLVNLLHYGDAISMAHSLESRLPFMDYRLVEFAFTLPPEYKIRLGLGKFIHRTAMKGIVPPYILDNPVKFGFESPLTHLFLKEGEDSAQAILLSERCLQRNLFAKEGVEQLFADLKAKKKDASRLLYRMLSVELWFRNFIDN